MALEAVVFSQDPFGYGSNRDLYSFSGGSWGSDFGLEEEHDQQVSNDFLGNQTESSTYGDYWNSPSEPNFNELHQFNPYQPEGAIAGDGLVLGEPSAQVDASAAMQARPRRRRSKSRKNKEEIENQRITHIAVERNRRKQMNEYLSMLRSLMPDSYVQRGDQASIIGGAINFVKELEQQVQFLSAQTGTMGNTDGVPSAPFSDFFTFPQYSTIPTVCDHSLAMADPAVQRHSSIADIEVTMVESHANIKIRSRRRPKQLLKMVSGLQTMRLALLHLNVTTLDQIVLYSLSVKVEESCNLTTGDDIATALYQLLSRIHEEASLD